MSAEEVVRAHLVISGRVQRVYFRQSTADEARSLGLAGWVRNAGEDVEAVFEGPRAAVERLIAWCHEGPPRASVERVDVRWSEPEETSGFSMR
ncbi:MAG: acylphosphatase [Coriobacteriia bacterium]|nr:acylphosphatase [Coriobacteriia bacterium]